eukprot:TRINITY_DN6861_c0_g1_i1.p2 TRINITY_DN6861_c0_g1~~TRINITY_DN6861_c0_g1_i1.p2  ORF type:complete len:394 (+),score=25.33 TRINITY_DN6861_c0_g1_i1:2097-3278(+)
MRGTCRSWARGISRSHAYIGAYHDSKRQKSLEKQLSSADFVACSPQLSLSDFDSLAAVLGSGRCPAKYLRFIGTGGVGMPTKALGRGLAGSKLCRLDVVSCGLKNGYFPLELFDGIEKCGTLSHVSLKGNMHPEFANAILGCLRSSSCLTKVNLTRNEITSSNFASLATFMAKDKQLRSLSLRWTKLGDEGAVLISKALLTNSTLTSLNLRPCQIGSSGSRALTTALLQNTALLKLSLGNNRMHPRDFAEGCFGSRCHLTQLDLSSISMGHSGARFLALALKGNFRLKNFNISRCGLRTEGIIFLLDFISYTRSLRFLAFAENEIGHAGAIKLARAVIINGNICLLDLRQNDFGAKRTAAEWRFLERISRITPHNLVERRSRQRIRRENYDSS